MNELGGLVLVPWSASAGGGTVRDASLSVDDSVCDEDSAVSTVPWVTCWLWVLGVRAYDPNGVNSSACGSDAYSHGVKVVSHPVTDRRLDWVLRWGCAYGRSCGRE